MEPHGPLVDNSTIAAIELVVSRVVRHVLRQIEAAKTLRTRIHLSDVRRLMLRFALETKAVTVKIDDIDLGLLFALHPAIIAITPVPAVLLHQVCLRGEGLPVLLTGDSNRQVDAF